MIPIKRLVLLGALLLVLAAGSASAMTMRANIPFPFVVHGRTMPAGQYLLIRDDNEPSLLVIREQGGDHARALVLTEPDAQKDPAGEASALRFTQRGSQYWLADLWQSTHQGWEVTGAPAAKPQTIVVK